MKLSGKEILEILKTVNALGYRYFRLEHGDLKLEVSAELAGSVDAGKTNRDVGPSQELEPTDRPPAPEATGIPAELREISAKPPREGLVAVKAPMTGTFYRASTPGAPPFVEVGTAVESGDTVCLIEVMKLFSSIPAGTAGTVIEICASNEALVAPGQPVMWIEPKA